MKTLGIDFAAQPEKTAAAIVLWRGGIGRLEELSVGWRDDRIAQAIRHCDKCGIDVPLGWPQAFVEAIAAHSARREWPQARMEHLVLRETDLYVRQQVGKVPLSVSTDKIGVTALRAAALLSEIDPKLDRAGSGKIIEVYPAVALKRWGFDPFEFEGDSRRLRYKGKKGRPVLQLLVKHVQGVLGPRFQATEDQWQLCGERDDALDALVSSLVARAATMGLTHKVPRSSADAASREGWIALPTEGSLPRLVQ